MRSSLRKQLKDFFQAVTIFPPTLEEVNFMPFEEELIDTPAEESVEPEDLLGGSLEEDSEEEEEEEDEAPSKLLEAVILPLPSRVVSDKLGPSLKSLRSIEREL